MVIEIRNASKVYLDGTQALDGFNLMMPDGAFLFLLGPSGAGKTTLFKLLMGMEKPTSGTVRVDGVDVAKATHGELRALRRKIGMVFQDFKLILRKTAMENVILPLRITGVPWGEIRDRGMQALRAVDLADKWNSMAGHLSAGEQQRIAIARAIVKRPSLILADEPTGNLDPDRSNLVMNLLLDENRRGATVLVATHDLDLVRGTGKEALRMNQGRLLQQQL